MTERSVLEIDRILGNAHDEGRDSLYEFEVYEILGRLGIGVPAYEYVRNINAVDEELLRRFHGPLIIKVVSADIAHKSRVGGVKRIDGSDPLFVRFALSNMREEVLSHFPAERRPRIDGFLLVEYIAFNQSLGNEILIGFTDDEAFGPVGTITKGGDDAEFFARAYDPPSLFLMPTDAAESRALIEGTKIHGKYVETGHPEYAGMLSDAIQRIGWLGSRYSLLCEQEPRYRITELDVNPLVFTRDGRFVAVDGFARFTPLHRAQEAPAHETNTEGMQRFFRPQGVVVVGVSTNAHKQSTARNIVELLANAGRRDVYIVNPKGGELTISGQTFPVYSSIEEVCHPYDLVVYAAPAQHSVDFIRHMPQNKALILISGIPSDMRFADFMQEARAAAPAGVRIIGPNCMGVMSVPGGGEPPVDTVFIEENRLPKTYSEGANAALFSQSGGLAIHLIESAGVSAPYKYVVSFGNKLDVTAPDLLKYFGKDPSVEVFAMYLEGLYPGEGRVLYNLAKAAGKPIVVLKSGRTEAGVRAAASHTASMTGRYDIFRSACAQSRHMIPAEDIAELDCLSRVFSLLAEKKPHGCRVAGVANAGLDSTMGADSIRYLQQATLRQPTIEQLQRINVTGLCDVHTSFLDVTPMADDAFYASFIETVLQDEDVDCLFVGIVPHIDNIKTLPGNCRDEDAIGPRLVRIFKASKKPIVVSVMGSSIYGAFVSVLEAGGMPVYPDIRSSIASLEAFVRYHIG